MDEPKEIYAQQLAKNSWGLVVDGETLEERFSTAKEACDFGRQKFGIEPKARMKKNRSKGSTKKGGAKKNSASPLTLRRRSLNPPLRRIMSQKFTLIEILESRRR